MIKDLLIGRNLTGCSVLNLIGFLLNLGKETRSCNTVLISSIRK